VAANRGGEESRTACTQASKGRLDRCSELELRFKRVERKDGRAGGELISYKKLCRKVEWRRAGRKS